MDAAFWDVNVSSPQTLEGSARFVPGEPGPIFTSPTSRTLRTQQLALWRHGFPLGIIPSISPTSPKDLGSFTLQSLLLKYAAPDWWVGLIGQFRPKKLITSLKEEVLAGDELEMPAFRDVAKHFLNKSLYSVGLCSKISLSPASSLYFSTEKHGEKEGRRTKAMFFHQLPNHDVTLEAAWPELFVDKNGSYWDVPSSLSLDLASLVSKSGLRYRFGIHRNSGHPRALSATCSDVPLALMPGVCAKAAFSYEKSRDIWRQKEKKKDLIVKTEKGKFWQLPYDTQLGEPHAAISGIIGGVCAAWFGGNGTMVGDSGAQLGLYNVVPGELTIVTGVPNSGKSEWIDALLCNINRSVGWKFALCSMENKVREHARKLLEKHIRKPFFNARYGESVERMSVEEFEQGKKWLNDTFHLIRCEDDCLPSIKWVLELAKAAVLRHGVRGLVIDPYNELDHQRPPNQTETEYVSQMLTKIKRFAQHHACHVWFVAHPRQLQHWVGGPPNLYDISGSAHFINKCDNGIVVHRNRDANAGPLDRVQICLRKVRNKVIGNIGDAFLSYNRTTGEFVDIDDAASR